MCRSTPFHTPPFYATIATIHSVPSGNTPHHHAKHWQHRATENGPFIASRSPAPLAQKQMPRKTSGPPSAPTHWALRQQPAESGPLHLYHQNGPTGALRPPREHLAATPAGTRSRRCATHTAPTGSGPHRRGTSGIPHDDAHTAPTRHAHYATDGPERGLGRNAATFPTRSRLPSKELALMYKP